MDTERLVSTLEGEGFSPYQARAYVALLERGESSASDLADAADVPGPRIYDVLRDLADEGYVETYDQGKLHARISSPADVLDEFHTRSDELEDAAEEVEARFTRPGPADHEATIVNNFETVLDRAVGLVEAAEHHVQVCLTPEQFDRLRDALAGAHERGVYVQLSIHSLDGDVDVDSVDVEGYCTEMRARSRGAPFVVIADHTSVCYASNPRRPDEYGVVVNDRNHAYVFLWYFLTNLWEFWDTVYTDRDSEYPRTYLEIRRCVRDVAPLVDEGARVAVRVVGYDVETGHHRDFVGEVVDVDYEGPEGENGPRSLQSLAGKTSLYVETDDGDVVSVGGFGAIVEEIEADRVVVEAVDAPDASNA